MATQEIKHTETQETLVAAVAQAERRVRTARTASAVAREESEKADIACRMAWGELRDFQDRLVEAELEQGR